MNLVRRFTVYISGENKKLKFPSSGNFVLLIFFRSFAVFLFLFSFSDHGIMVSEEENCRLVHGGLYQMVEWMQCDAL